MLAGMTFVEQLIREVPELVEVEVGQTFDLGEVIPHVFMGDVTRFTERLHDSALAGSASDDEVLTRLLAVLEAGLRTGDDSVDVLISTSFLENLDRDRPGYADLAQRLGPLLRERLSLM